MTPLKEINSLLTILMAGCILSQIHLAVELAKHIVRRNTTLETVAAFSSTFITAGTTFQLHLDSEQLSWNK